MAGDKVWVCGRRLDPKDDRMWALQGIFTDREQAIQACKDKTYFIGSVILDVELPPEVEPFPESGYPLAN